MINNKVKIVNSIKVAKTTKTSTTSTNNTNPNSKLINVKAASSTHKQIDLDSDDEDDKVFFLASSKVKVILNILTNDLA